MNARSLQPIVATVLLLCAGAGALADGFAGLGSDARGFAEVVPGKALVFPEDFGAHPAFRIEWWYLTANLKDDPGNSYGVQWTLFRQAMEPGPERQGWSNQQVWMGHAAVTSAAEHLFAETLARGGIGQAGVTAAPFRAWIDDWSFLSVDPSPEGGLSRANVSAKGSNFRSATLSTLKRASPSSGTANRALAASLRVDRHRTTTANHSLPRTASSSSVAGRCELGQAWMDREWSSRPLTSDQKGWDWFSLHFASGEKLMVFRLRSEEASAFNSGTSIASDGTAQPLGNSDIVRHRFPKAPPMVARYRQLGRSRSRAMTSTLRRCHSMQTAGWRQAFLIGKAPSVLQGLGRVADIWR